MRNVHRLRGNHVALKSPMHAARGDDVLAARMGCRVHIELVACRTGGRLRGVQEPLTVVVTGRVRAVGHSWLRRFGAGGHEVDDVAFPHDLHR